MNTAKILRDLQAETLAARERTGMDEIGVSVAHGLFRVEFVTITPTYSDVRPVSQYLPFEQAIEFLRAMR